MTLKSEAPSSVDKSYELERRKIGSSELVMTEVSLGTMTWGQQNTEDDAHAQLDIAYERGVVGIDTAESYPVPPIGTTFGRTERYIGSWLRKKGGKGFRDNVVILSKVAGASGTSRSLQWIRGGNRHVDRKSIFAAVDGILERLGTDYIDCLQIHWPDRYVPLFGERDYIPENAWETVSFEEQLIAFNDLIKQGKIRYMGLSNETAWGVAQFATKAERLGVAKPISIQNGYNLLDRSFEGQLVEACAKNNGDMPLLAYSPLAGGALSGKYLGGKSPKGSRFTMFGSYMARYHASVAAEATEKYQQVAEHAGLTMVQLALAWCKQKRFIGSTIIGATSVEQLNEDIGAFSVELDEATVAAINKVYERYRDPSVTS